MDFTTGPSIRTSAIRSSPNSSGSRSCRSFRAEVERTLAGATLLHLWSEAIRWSAYDFAACPPPGSYLHDVFRKVGALDRFRRSYDEGEVRRLMASQIAACEARAPDAQR